MKRKFLCLCLALLLLLSLAACGKSVDEQESQTPAPAPTATPIPTPPIPYTDVPENSNYYDAVVWAYENGIASGGDTFEPLSNCTRGQAITFLWRAMGSPEPQLTESPVTDIAPSNWFYKPVLWAYESGISTSSTFKPNNPCTNGEALTFLWRAMDKPMAAVSSSTVALAADGAYYQRPAAWADSNGLFAQMGAGFDPAAPCSRAYLVSYLYWADGQQVSVEKNKALQAEYEQIINSVQPARLYGSGLIYADYVDMDHDGKVELLTIGNELEALTVTATVYADRNGHAEKLCEQVLDLYGAFNNIDIYQADNQLYLGIGMMHRYVGYEYTFFTVKDGAFVCSDNIREEYDSNLDRTRYIGLNETEISEDEYRAIYKKYTKQKEIFYNGPADFEFGERGILTDPHVEVNGTPVKLSTAPYYSVFDFEPMVPLRDVLEAMGVAVYANSDASVILASTKSDTLVIMCEERYLEGYLYNGINDITADSRKDKTYQYSMNGGEFQKTTIEFTNGKACALIQTIVPLFGGKAEWDGEAGAMQITSNIPDSNRMTQDELKKIANFGAEQAQQLAAKKLEVNYERIYFGNPDGRTDGHFAFKHGKMIWIGTVTISFEYERDVYGEIVAAYDVWYPIEVASDGTVTAHPDDITRSYSSQF